MKSYLQTNNSRTVRHNIADSSNEKSVVGSLTCNNT